MKTSQVVFLTQKYNALKYTIDNYSELKNFIEINNFEFDKLSNNNLIMFYDIDGIIQYVTHNQWLVIAENDSVEYYILDEKDYLKMFQT